MRRGGDGECGRGRPRAQELLFAELAGALVGEAIELGAEIGDFAADLLESARGARLVGFGVGFRSAGPAFH